MGYAFRIHILCLSILLLAALTAGGGSSSAVGLSLRNRLRVIFNRREACPSRRTLGCAVTPKDSCRTDYDCRRAQRKCCQTECGMKCVPGIKTSPKDGQCPVPSNAACLRDFLGCQYDSECGINQKCCPTANCGYKQCEAMLPRTPATRDPSLPEKCPLEGYKEPDSRCINKAPMPEAGLSGCLFCSDINQPCTKIGCGADKPGPGCRRIGVSYPNGVNCNYCLSCRDLNDTPPPPNPPPVIDPTTPAPAVNKSNLICRGSTLFFCPEQRITNLCLHDSNCGVGEKCCYLECGNRCIQGIDPTPKAGECPAVSQGSGCIADFSGCIADSQCEGSKKCCQHSTCRYFECV